MPQPKNTPATAPPAEGTAPAQDTAPVKRGDTLIDEYFEDAIKLAAEKKELHDRIGANRDALRLFAKTGKINEDGMKELDKLYPPREGKGKGNGTAAAAPAAAATS